MGESSDAQPELKITPLKELGSFGSSIKQPQHVSAESQENMELHCSSRMTDLPVGGNEDATHELNMTHLHELGIWDDSTLVADLQESTELLCSSCMTDFQTAVDRKCLTELGVMEIGDTDARSPVCLGVTHLPELDESRDDLNSRFIIPKQGSTKVLSAGE